MSKYHQIKTEYRNPASLIRALADLGAPAALAGDPRESSLPLYGYRSDPRPEQAGIVIGQCWINTHWSNDTYRRGLSNDIGFAWDGQQMQVILSEYDQARPGVQAALEKLRQRYAFHELQAQAHQAGFWVQESYAGPDGALNLVLVKQGG